MVLPCGSYPEAPSLCAVHSWRRSPCAHHDTSHGHAITMMMVEVPEAPTSWSDVRYLQRAMRNRSGMPDPD